jgi:hypothetical protein
VLESQVLKPAAVRRDRDDVVAGGHEAPDDQPTDCPGAADNDDWCSDCPVGGMNYPTSGTIGSSFQAFTRKCLIGLSVFGVA